MRSLAIASTSKSKRCHLSDDTSCFELLTRLELVTSSLPRKCSTTELQQHSLRICDAKVHKIFESANFLSKKMKNYKLFNPQNNQ